MGFGGFFDDVLGLTPEVSAVAGVEALEFLRTFRDELAGVEQVEVTNPDGTRSIVTRKIAQSKEQQLKNQQIEEGITALLNQAQQLADIGVAAESKQFKPIVDKQTELLQAQLAEQETKAIKQQEEALAARGLSSSTTGTQARAALAGDVATQQLGIQLQGLTLGEQLRESALNRTLSSLSPFTQQQGFASQLEQLALNRGTGLQTTLAAQELQRQALNKNIQLSNANQYFQQSQAGAELAQGAAMGIMKGISGSGSLGSGQLGSFLSSAFAASDKRLKQDIKYVGEKNGFNVYEFAYRSNPSKKYVGVMAQEIQELLPSAVKEIDGYLAVDYSQLGFNMEEIN